MSEKLLPRKGFISAMGASLLGMFAGSGLFGSRSQVVGKNEVTERKTAGAVRVQADPRAVPCASRHD